MIQYFDTQYTVNLPKMTSPSELGLCRYLADEIGRDDPVIFDLGPWMGATTVAFRDGNPLATIHVVDTFTWAPYMEKAYARFHGQNSKYITGNSFLVEFLYNIHWHVDSNIYIHQGDLATVLPPQEKADILFCDALKRPGCCYNVILHWMSILKVGGFFIDQDFRWNPLMYVHWLVAMWRLKEFYTPVFVAKGGQAVCWKKIKEPTIAEKVIAATFRLEKDGQSMRKQTVEILEAVDFYRSEVGL